VFERVSLVNKTKMIVFTNGCFDVLHPGHFELLKQAKAYGSRLIVGINSDESVRRIKGNGRPLFTQEERRQMLLSLESVDEVRIFDDPTPERLIREIAPDVLVKGGDWKDGEIIGADFVRDNGGKVFTVPFVDDYSTTAILERLTGSKANGMDDGLETVENSLRQHSSVMEMLYEQTRERISECSDILLKTFRTGGKLLVCGNGGSAADAQHIAAEFTGRYELERRALPAVALTTDSSALTAVSNDFGFEQVFVRQVEALAQAGDCLLAISTSGTSENVIAAVMAARSLGCTVIGLTGASGKKLASLSDACVLVPSERTSRIQEAHITVAHIWCETIDQAFTAPNDDRPFRF
jgi:D-sedoheptulose 7-phosphate isomerase